MTVAIEIGPGELVDKITILEIKACRIGAAAKLENVRAELRLLQAARDRLDRRHDAQLATLTTSLRTVNETLWEVEDRLRDCERAQRFDAEFVALARAVYKTNDQRAALKRQINELFSSTIVEEKSYAAY